MKKLIINADDFGYSHIFNKSILKYLENEMIKSTTVMVNWITEEQKPQLEELKTIRNHKNISVGLHYEHQEGNQKEKLLEQYENFIKYFEKKPSHIDWHKSPPEDFFEAYLILAKEKQRKTRKKEGLLFENKTPDFQYINGSRISLNEIEATIKNLKENKIYEILFHPGTFDPDSISTLNKKREEDNEKIELIDKLKEKYDLEILSFEKL